jgi:hypothetical protein
MATMVDICNYALANLSVQPIATMTDKTSKAARNCNLLFEITRDTVLRDFPWGFANQEIVLALSSGDTASGWSYVYQYPANCLKVRKVFMDGLPDPELSDPFDEQMIGGSLKIVTNTSKARAKFTAKIKDTTFYDVQFIEAFSYKLAAAVAIPMTNNVGLRNDMIKLYLQFISAAQTSSATEKYKDPQRGNRYTGGRWG